MNKPTMLKNFLKIAWRNFLHHKGYSIVNMLGLSLGLCACIVIYLVTSYEFSFDTFHPEAKKIYRVRADITENSGDKLKYIRVPTDVASAGRNTITGIESMAALIPFNARITILPGNEYKSREESSNFITTVFAEPQYFDIFNYKWLAGSALTALSEPFRVVLTESRAREYFGNEQLGKMIGKQIVYQDSLIVTVSGIIKDWEEPTDLGFSDFISFATINSSFLKNNIRLDSWKQGDLSAWVFARLNGKSKPASIDNQLAHIAKIKGDPGTKMSLWLESLSSIHFSDDVIENPIRTANKTTLFTLIGIAIFILLLGLVNYINLSTALSIRRAKEIGVRKVLGSSRRRLIFQFLAETWILTFVAILLAILMVNAALNGFSSFIPVGVSFKLFQPSTIFFLLILSLVTSLAAGFYPAKVISGYLPATVMKGQGSGKGSEKWYLRKGLIVFQFTVSLVFIIGSIVVATQLRYTRTMDTGFNPANIIIIDTKDRSKINVLAENIRQMPGVNNVALQWVSPMTENARGMKLKLKNTDEKDFWVTQVAGNEDFIPLYQIKLLAGRNLNRSDSVTEFVINEKLSHLIGSEYPAQSLGRMLYWNDRPYPVVGVVADFHTSSLHDPVTPLCIINRPERQGTIAVKFAGNKKQVAQLLSGMERTWNTIYPDNPFQYRFYDQSLDLLYKKDKQTAILIKGAMIVAIFISCMGLFGLSLYSTERRAKEISIRKTLGATIANIIMMLSREFVFLVLVSLVIASPVAWYFMNKWLQGFAYHINIEWWIFVLAGCVSVFIVLITTGFHALKAALASPIRWLRRE
jgi:putative ABC transport system permease protein